MMKTWLIRIWLYFKKGRNEISFFYTSFNTVLLISLAFDIQLTTRQYALFGVGFLIAAIVFGKFITREVEPQNSIINPFTRDNIESQCVMMKAMQLSMNGDYEEAIKVMDYALLLREKWLK